MVAGRVAARLLAPGDVETLLGPTRKPEELVRLSVLDLRTARQQIPAATVVVKLELLPSDSRYGMSEPDAARRKLAIDEPTDLSETKC